MTDCTSDENKYDDTKFDNTTFDNTTFDNITFQGDQLEAMQHLMMHLNNTKQQKFLLIGSAGVGKTYLLCLFLKRFNQTRDFVIVSPTNKALSVLKKKVYETNARTGNVKFLTLAKLLNLEVDYGKDGKKRFINKSGFKMPTFDDSEKDTVIVVDEVSMIGEQQVVDLDTFLDKFKCKSIYSGDACQLPPVNEKQSIIFEEQNKFMMSKIIRTSNMELAKIYQLFRDNVLLDKPLHISSDYFTRSNKVFISKLKAYLRQADKKNADFVVISYSNRQTLQYNQLCKKILFPNEKRKFFPGLRMCFNDFMLYPWNKDGRFISFYSCDPFVVSSVTYNIRYYSELLDTTFLFDKIRFHSGDDGDKYLLYPVGRNAQKQAVQKKLNDHKRKIKAIIDDDTKNGLWSDMWFGNNNNDDISIGVTGYERSEFFCDIRETDSDAMAVIKTSISVYRSRFDNIDKSTKLHDILWKAFYLEQARLLPPICEGYAITSHKSQGSTYDHVFCDLKNIDLCCRDKFTKSTSMYVAVSRASKSLFGLW